MSSPHEGTGLQEAHHVVAIERGSPPPIESVVELVQKFVSSRIPVAVCLVTTVYGA